MDFSTVRVLPIVASGVAFMLVGSMWYGALFGKKWMEITGLTMEQAKATPPNVMMRMYGGSFIAALVASYVLSVFIDATMMTTLSGGVKVGIAAALGFSGTAFASGYLFNRKPLTLWFIDAGYQLACLTIAGAILGAWR
jgi:hypothetical protein